MLIEEKKSRFRTKIEKMRKHLSVNNTLITEERKLILSYPILELVEKLRDGDLDPVTVLEAYQVTFNRSLKSFFLISVLMLCLTG